MSSTAVPADDVLPSATADWLELIKARLNTFVLFSALAGFLSASRGVPLVWSKAAAAVIGIGLVAGAAAALNQWMEREVDARMERTKDRPLPSGRMKPSSALIAGIAMALAGLATLWLFAGQLPACLAFATLFIYLAIYTPLKQHSVWCVPVGAVAGALPPLIGAVTATGRVEAVGVFLFLVLAFWQFPHFFAIAWMYREDYANAGFVVLPRGDTTGRFTAILATVFSALLLALTAEYCYQGYGSMWFLGATILPGILLMGGSFDFLMERSHANARKLFLTSILYLPVVLIAAVLLR